MQTIPTFYVQTALILWHEKVVLVRRWWRLQIGLLTCAPLIFVYPWLVQQSGLSLGAINALMHLVVGLAWALQIDGFSKLCVVHEAEQ